MHTCLLVGSFVALAEYESVLGRYACTCSTHRNPIAEPRVWGLGFRAWGLGFKVRAQKPARGIEVVGKHVGQNCCPGRDFAGGCCNWSNAAMNRCCRLAHADRARSFKSKKSTHHAGVRLLAPLPLRLSLSHTQSLRCCNPARTLLWTTSEQAARENAQGPTGASGRRRVKRWKKKSAQTERPTQTHKPDLRAMDNEEDRCL